MKLFPVLGCRRLHDILPWDMMEPHATQAFANHGQSLTTIARRGGLSPCEALAVLENRPYRLMPRAESERLLEEHVRKYHEEERLLDTVAHRHPSEGETE